MSTTSSAASKPSGPWQPPTLEEMQAMLPQYEFISLLGRGGMGAVYKAVQTTLDRTVAIKVLPGDLIDDTDAQFAERFKNEARTMAKMNHPAIVNVYDFGETQTGLLYIVMEFIDGTDVSKMIISQGKLPEEYALSITAHVCDALNYAHRHGVIHRDIKPANILINMEGAVKVADFGLAKASDAGQSGLTKTNMAMGTPDFVAPEALIPGIPLDGRADLYAIGVMLYQMLTGEIPRGIWTLPGMKLGTDPRFDAIISKAMQTDRDHRYQSAAALRQDLDVILTMPRAALIAQQQAAAEAAARATRTQPPPATQARPEAAAVKKKPFPLGPVLGIAATIVLVAGLVYMLKPPAKKPASQTAASTTKPPAASAPASMPESAPVPTPAPNGSAGFSNFAPTAQWRDELAGSEAWNSDWQRVGGEMHRNSDHNAMRIFADSRKDAGLRVRFRSHVHDAFLDLIQRLNKSSTTPRYVATLWMSEKRGGMLSLIPVKQGEKTRHLAPLNRNTPLDTGTEHTAEIYAIGDRLTVFLDGQQLSEAQDTTFTAGFPAVYASKGIELIRVETVVLDAPTPANPPDPAPVVSTSPVMTPAPASPVPAANPILPPGWTDLMTTADVTRDATQGQWTMTSAGLHCKEGGGMEYFKLNPTPPEEYDFEMEFTVIKGVTYGTVSQVIVVPGHRFALHISSKYICLGANLDGTRWDDPERTEALSRETGFKPGQRIRAKVEIRRGTARVLLDDKEVINWSGDFKRLELHTRSYNQKDTTQLAVACQNAEVVFHRISVAPWPMPAAVASTTPVMPAPPPPQPSPTTPSAAPTDLTSLLAAHPQLAKLDAGFKSRYEADAQKPFLTALATLNQSYVTNGIARARSAAQAKGSLAEVTALDAEKAAIANGNGVPAADAEGTPASLKTLRGTYRTALAKITAERDAKAAPLYALYLKALDAYTAELTQGNKLDAARQVSALRDDIAAQHPQTAAAAPAATTKPSVAATPAAPVKPAAGGGSSWRTAAQYLVGASASIVVAKGGIVGNVTTEKDIPSGRFDILEINFDRLNSVLPPPKDADFQALMGLRDLRRVSVRTMSSGLSDAAFTFLASNPELVFLNLEGVSDITDEMLTHLAGAKKLDFLGVQHAQGFTGKGLGKLPGLATLTNVEYLGSGITDDGVKALAQCKRLGTIRITSTTVTDSGFTALRSLKTLASVNVAGTAFGDEAASAFASLTNLTTLDLSSTKLTDLGLTKLLVLKKLTSLNLGGTTISVEAAAAFQQALPQCRVIK